MENEVCRYLSKAYWAKSLQPKSQYAFLKTDDNMLNGRGGTWLKLQILSLERNSINQGLG
jgi:hypothetical protein